CVPASGACELDDLPNTTPCEDGNLCTLSDTCQSGACQPGTPMSCDTSNDPDCQQTQCIPATGTCELEDRPNTTPCDDGELCTENDTCQSGVCQPGAPPACDPNASCDDSGPTAACVCNDGYE